MQYIITAQAKALGIALKEAGNARVVRLLEPGVALCEDVGRVSHPVFLRHICPAEVAVPLTGEAEDIERLGDALRPLLPQLAGKASFSVQTRIIEGYQPGYKRFDVNTPLAQLVQAEGIALDVKNPQMAVSVTLAEGMGWIGISAVADNLSDWAGGARRYKVEAGQVSRAEFKLLEAMETFGITVEDGQHALDLGAAPGGWTRILRRRGLYVAAVDPAALDKRIERDPRVTHYRETAQVYFKHPNPCDIMVNDMKMDSDESAALMVSGAHCLQTGGIALLTLKLPEDESEWVDRVERARTALDAAYEVTDVRQLFHNRSEVTVCMRRK